MSDFSVTWDLVRGRFLGALEGLTDEQLNRRLHKNALSIGEMAIHVAGVEIYFAYQLTGTPIEGEVIDPGGGIASRTDLLHRRHQYSLPCFSRVSHTNRLVCILSRKEVRVTGN